MEIKYPHWVIPESEFKKERHTFCGFYMPDLEVEKLHKLFPNGCNDRYVNEYSIPYDGNMNLTDKIYKDNLNHLFQSMRDLAKSVQWLLWDWDDLLHDGYHPVWDNSLKLACGKGKIKPNKHTVIIMLDKVPDKVSKLWKEVVKQYIIPMQEIVRNADSK
jgi:hypothetical protein